MNLKGGDNIKEEGIETIKSLIILAAFLGTAFTVAALVPSEEVCCDDLRPLEVQKNRISGPVIVVIDNPATWQLDILVINNLDPVVEDPVNEEVNNDVDEEPNLPVYCFSTRGSGEDRALHTIMISPNTITDVVVKDTLPAEFELFEFTPTQGDVSINIGEKGATLLTWNVGNLEPKARATLTLSVRIANGGFSKPGSYIINSGATVSGFLHSTQEILTDGPTNPIFVTVTDGDPNEAPVADAGIDQMAFEGNPVYLDGSGSYDPDGTIVRYTWYLDGERIGSSRSVLSYLLPVGVHTITLVVEDNRRFTDTDEVTVTVYEEDAEVSGGVMTGVVRDATTSVGFDPYIQLTNENYAISTWTDFEGNYRIIGIPEGHYEVFCMAEGYQDFYGEVYIPENGEAHYDIDMFRA